MGQPLLFANARLAKTQPQVLRLRYKITAAKTLSEMAPGGAALLSFDAITQATFDAFGSLATGEVNAAFFDATSMGTDTHGGALDMNGQAGKLLKVTSVYRSGTGLTTVLSVTSLGASGMTATTNATESVCTTQGNLLFRALLSGIDAATSGTIEHELEWIPKPA